MWLRVSVLTVSTLLCAAETRAAEETSASEEVLIKTPPDARLQGTSVIQEIRAFPEMGIKGRITGKPQAATVVDIEGIDRVFETNKSFGETASFFEQQFKQPGFQVTARVESQSATAWTVKRPDGSVANVIVRNTKPTTFEIAEISASAVKVKPIER